VGKIAEQKGKQNLWVGGSNIRRVNRGTRGFLRKGGKGDASKKTCFTLKPGQMEPHWKKIAV